MKRHRFGSTLVKVTVCTCSVPNKYMRQCLVIVIWTLSNNETHAKASKFSVKRHLNANSGHFVQTALCCPIYLQFGFEQNVLDTLTLWAFNSWAFLTEFKCDQMVDKQRVLMHGHQGWNVRHGLCHIYMIYVYIWVVHSFCLFCCLFIIVTTQFVALYEPCKPKPKPKPSTYDTRTTTPWQRSKFRYLDRSQSNKYAINMQIQTISVSK